MNGEISYVKILMPKSDIQCEKVFDQDRTPLYDAMKWHVSRDVAPFDVPGHKRSNYIDKLAEFIGPETIKYDVNSMPGLDNVNSPTGAIAEAEMLMADAFGASHAYLMVGGTTQSVQAMILAACSPNDKIILPRNVHKSVSNALILSNAMPVYMQPDICPKMNFATGISFETAKNVIDENLDAKAILLINPTYYGTASALENITKYAKSKGLIVLVDEAHGAHLNFHDDLPKSAMSCGADLAAVSIHKTGGALSQSSALLLNSDRLPEEKVRKAINLLQTTSASYLLMTSLDIARRNLAVNGQKQLSKVLELVRNAREQINEIPGLYAYGIELIGENAVHDFDETKLGINVTDLGFTGFEVYKMLHQDYNVQMELADTDIVLAIVSLGDSKEHLDTLVAALRDIAKKRRDVVKEEHVSVPNVNPVVRMTPRDAFYANKEHCPLHESTGRICAESIMFYPPGIPFLTPGEEITEEIVEFMTFLKSQPSQLTDMSDPTCETILVVDNK